MIQISEDGPQNAKDPILFAGGDTDLYGYCLNDPVNWIDALGLYIRHWGEDKLPPWLRDKRTDEEREAAHKKYNKDLKKRFIEAGGYGILHSKIEKFFLQPVYKAFTFPFTSKEDNTRPPWWPPFSPPPQNRPCE